VSEKKERYALLAVTDRSGIVEFAYALAEFGFTIVSAGGTLNALRQAELKVMDARELIGEPDLAEGRLGLLHPKLLAGLSSAEPEIELVAVNLYPVAEIVGDSKLSQAEVLDYIDLSGSSLLRAAARNFPKVIALCDPDDYQPTIESLRSYKRVAPDRRQKLAAKAFHYTAYYDTTVAQYLGEKWDKLPDELVIGLKKTAELHYGENPQQQGALYTLSGARPWGLNAAQLVYGKPLSYNHYLDLEVAWELATEIGEPACAIVKHAVPAGLASSERLADAARLAYRCDPRGCFRGTAAVNRELDEDAAALLAEEIVACIAAPEFSHKALQILKSKKDIRLVTVPSTLISAHEMDLKAVAGGVLVQEKDHATAENRRVVTRKQPGEVEMKALRLAWHAAKHARTHAAVLCRGSYAIGIGSGQTSRLDAVRLALVKSQERHPIVPAGLPIVMACDAALSAEHVHEAAQAGVTAIIQPGGSSDDKDAVEAADARGIAMVFTGVRHFRH
jgi:phosphoribosylaminoimidazolecarboxamide formyltransferase / IMP cyclohydrolase